MTRVNLYSDTQTRPTQGMREAIAAAEVGDEQRFEDPTVLALQERVAELLGFEAALFLPTGTMCNAIGFRLHIGPAGEAAYMHRLSHPLRAEAGGPAALSGAVLWPLEGSRGMFEARTLTEALPPAGDRYAVRPRLVSVENTTNLAGGLIWPLEQLRGVVSVARERGLRLHLDGARLMNAVVASGVPATEYCSGFDTAWIDFTKGLGAPVGAVLAGSSETIAEAWRYKQMFGGAMRQAGIVAAACLYALDHHVDRLAEDHANAAALAFGLDALPRIEVVPPETNIVIFRVPDARAFCTRMAEEGVDLVPIDDVTVRAVTHLDVSEDDVRTAIAAAARVEGPER
jgi:threonine aldolase